jgi:iron complex outermembrane receptor protein
MAESTRDDCFQPFLFLTDRQKQISRYMKKGFLTVLALTTLFSAQQAGAQTGDTDVLLDPVTVSSSLVERRSSETGRNITIIKGESLAGVPVHSLDELLKFVPGVDVQTRGPLGAQSDITLRGGTFQQVLVILDGMRLNDPNTGHFTAYFPITPAQIDRVEILKGPSAAIYGADAVGGVIHIITKAFQSATQNRNGISAEASAGEYGLVHIQAGGYLQTEKMSLDAGVLSNHTTGVQQRGTRGFVHNTTVSAGAGFRLSPRLYLNYRASYDNRDFAAQNFYTASVADTASEKVTTWWQQAGLRYENGGTRLSLSAAYKNLDDQYAFNPSSMANSNKTDLWQSRLLWRQRLSGQSTLITGADFMQKSIVSNDRGDHTLRTGAPFATLVQKAGEHLTITPSLRLEMIGSLPAEWVPQLTVSYKLNRLQLRTSGGKTIRDADFTERYNNYGKTIVGAGQRVGYPGLHSERSWGYEAGFDLFLPVFRLSSTLFQRYHTQLIDWVATPYAEMPRKDNLSPSASYGLAKNISSVNTTGWETDFQYLEKFNDQHQISLTGGFIWLYSSSSEARPSFYISSHARFLSDFMIEYRYRALKLNFSGIYKELKDQQPQGNTVNASKDYFLLNGRASWQFLDGVPGIFVQVDNMLNRIYRDFAGVQMPGRWVQAGVYLNFNKH